MPPTPSASPLLRWFKPIAIAEGVSFLLLMGVAMPLKYLAGLPQAVQVMGWLHGLLFIAYGVTGMLLFTHGNWPLERASGVFLASILPGGTFVLERKWLR